MPQSNHPRGGGATLAQVATASGTSIATASKALNGRGGVSPVTRERVIEVAAKLGYTSRYSPSRELLIAMVTDTFSSLYATEVLTGACREAGLRNTRITVASLDGIRAAADDEVLSQRWLHRIAETHIGLITVTTKVSSAVTAACRRFGLTLVAIDPQEHPSNSMIEIGATNWNGARDAALHLIDLGHECIAYVGGPKGSMPSFERYQGYLSALKERGLQACDDLVRWGEFDFDTGCRAGAELLSLPRERRPTAFLCASDWIALGVIDSAARAGLSIPDSVSVVGFDDTKIASTSLPRMTTVRQPIAAMGATAVRTIIDIRRGSSSAPMSLATELIIRESTGPAPKR